MIRLLRDIALAGAVLAIIAAAIHFYLSITTATVYNKTDQPLAAVEIGFTGKKLWQGDLAAGDSKWVFGIPNQDGILYVSYSLGAQDHETACGYVTSGYMSASLTVSILPDGKFNCEDHR